MIQWMAARAAARAWWPALVGAVTIAGPVFMLGQCSGVQIQKARAAAAQISTVEVLGRANAAAAGERVEDVGRIASRQQEQTRVIQSTPDQKPGPGRLRRACVQLRQQGASAERLPTECRSAG
jgi:hypothetical protein